MRSLRPLGEDELPKDKWAHIATVVLHMAGLIGFLVYGGLNLADGFQRPILIEHNVPQQYLPLPGVVICGGCYGHHEDFDEMICPDLICSGGDFGTETEDCGEYLEALPNDGSFVFSGYPTFITSAKEAVGPSKENCYILRPPPDTAFDERKDKRDRLNVYWEYENKDVTEEELFVRPIELAYGLFDTANPQQDRVVLDMYFSQVLRGTEYLYVTRIEEQSLHPPAGQPTTNFRWEVAKRSSVRKNAPMFSLEIIPTSFDRRLRAEQPRYTWIEFLSGLAGTMSFLLSLYYAVVGAPKLTPWGFIPKYITRTAPSSECRNGGLKYTLEEVRKKHFYIGYSTPEVDPKSGAIGGHEYHGRRGSATRGQSEYQIAERLQRLSNQLSAPTLSVLSRRMEILENVLSKHYNAELAPTILLEMLKMQADDEAAGITSSSQSGIFMSPATATTTRVAGPPPRESSALGSPLRDSSSSISGLGVSASLAAVGRMSAQTVQPPQPIGTIPTIPNLPHHSSPHQTPPPGYPPMIQRRPLVSPLHRPVNAQQSPPPPPHPPLPVSQVPQLPDMMQTMPTSTTLSPPANAPENQDESLLSTTNVNNKPNLPY